MKLDKNFIITIGLFKLLHNIDRILFKISLILSKLIFRKNMFKLNCLIDYGKNKSILRKLTTSLLQTTLAILQHKYRKKVFLLISSVIMVNV